MYLDISLIFVMRNAVLIYVIKVINLGLSRVKYRSEPDM